LGIEPLGLAYSKLSTSEFRKKWMTAYTRLSANPAAAVTAARTLLETVFKTIVSERGGTPDESGNLARLLQQAQNAVGFLRPANQSEHQIITGLTSVIGGVAGISNAAGDRHGTAQGITLQDKHLAVLCVHSCGAVGLCFIEKHLFTPMPLIGGAAIEADAT
jgi:Abortive infection C-terminus